MTLDATGEAMAPGAHLRVGYCCLNNTLKSAFRRTTLKKWQSLLRGERETLCIQIVIQNLTELKRLTEWNRQNRIMAYRIPSGLIPLVDHKQHTLHIQRLLKNTKAIQDAFLETARTMEAYRNAGGVVSLHPSQYIVLSSEKPDVVDSAVLHLDMACEFLGNIGCYPSVVNVHVSSGSTKERSTEEIAKAVHRALQRLSSQAQQCLTFENEDRGRWTVSNLVRYFEQPLVFDTLHWRTNPDTEDIRHAASAALKTWQGTTLCPSMHFSSPLGRSEKLMRQHSDFVEQRPHAFGFQVMELEVKQKDLALLRLRQDLRKRDPQCLPIDWGPLTQQLLKPEHNG